MVVFHEKRAKGEPHSGHMGEITDRCHRGDVWRTKDIGKAGKDIVLNALGSSPQPAHELGAVFLFGPVHFIGYPAESLIPGDLLPLSFSPFALPHQRMFYAVGMVAYLQGCLC